MLLTTTTQALLRKRNRERNGLLKRLRCLSTAVTRYEARHATCSFVCANYLSHSTGWATGRLSSATQNSTSILALLWISRTGKHHHLFVKRFIGIDGAPVSEHISLMLTNNIIQMLAHIFPPKSVPLSQTAAHYSRRPV